MQKKFEIIVDIFPEYCILDAELNYNESELFPNVVTGKFDKNSLVHKEATKYAIKYCKENNLNFNSILKIYPLYEYEPVV